MIASLISFADAKLRRGGRSGQLETGGRRIKALPRNLYLQQLRDRLGERAVINFATAEQRMGRVWERLVAKSGE